MKRYVFKIPAHKVDDFEKLIKDKIGFSVVLLDAIQIILTEHYCENLQQGNMVVVNISKMKRLIVVLNSKIFSCHFPFNIELREEADENLFRITLPYTTVAIDNQYLSIVKSFISSKLQKCLAIDYLLEEFWEHIRENNINDESAERDLSIILLYLLNIEPGYLRYDKDEEHKNGDLHPEHHFDMFYSNSTKLKIGLKKGIDMKEFVDFLDIETDVRYLE